MNEESIDNPR
jgi:hypothetical protein